MHITGENMTNTIDWLMEGDAAVRWQVMRDLLDAPEGDWQAERRRTAESGWGAQLMAQQDAQGSWGGGIYTPKWTSTTYTLLALCGIGIPGESAAARQGAERAVSGLVGAQRDQAFAEKLEHMDRCITGMALQIAAYFKLDDDRLDALVDNVLEERMEDGGWNCRRHRKPEPHHSSFHTTFNVLDGVRQYLEGDGQHRREELLAAEQGALALMLEHRLYRSSRTGEVIKDQFTRLTYPPRWHYDMLRGLDYFARAGARRDPRLEDAITLLRSKRSEDGTWKLEQKYSGVVYFDMEKLGKPSRWVTLRALRVLRWWES
jgi:hypothetical protein